MCELAVITHDKGSDSAKGHREGDIIAVMPDGHGWGLREDKRTHLAKFGNTEDWSGNFLIIQITDLSVEDAQEYLKPRTRPAHIADPEFLAPDVEDRVAQVVRKAWSIDINALPLPLKIELALIGFIKVTRNQIAPQFRNKETGKDING